jgi:hypothetical protein
MVMWADAVKPYATETGLILDIAKDKDKLDSVTSL